MKKYAIILSLSFMFAYQPSDAERARWTMSDFRTVATAAAAYKVDHDAYPVAGSMAELQKLVSRSTSRACRCTTHGETSFVTRRTARR